MAKKKRITLRQYYKTDHWKHLYYRFSLCNDAECEFCGAKRWGYYKRGPNKGKRKKRRKCLLHLHHKHYDTLFNETREDLLLLCDNCHKLGHLLHKIKTKGGIYKKMYNDYFEKGWRFKKR